MGQSTEILDFFQQNALYEFLPATRLHLNRGGFTPDPKSKNKISTVSELARVDPEVLRAYFT